MAESYNIIQPSNDAEATAIAVAWAIARTIGLGLPASAKRNETARAVGELSREILAGMRSDAKPAGPPASVAVKPAKP